MRRAVPAALLCAAIAVGATAVPAGAATRPKDKVTVHWQTLTPHWGAFDHFHGTVPAWTKKVAVQRLVGGRWQTMWTQDVENRTFTGAVALVSSLDATNRILALGTAGHKSVASKPVALTAVAPTQIADLTGDGPSTSQAIQVRDYVEVDATWTCAGEPNGHAMSVEAMQDGFVMGNITDAPTSAGTDGNIVETDSSPLTLEVVGASDCHWELKVYGCPSIRSGRALGRPGPRSSPRAGRVRLRPSHPPTWSTACA